MRVSVIIPALNEAERIGRAVDRAWLAGATEVIVVDGGSEDGTRELASQRSCRLLVSPPGRAGQQNAGAAAAEGDVLLFLHADNYLAEGAVAQIVAALADSSCPGGAFRQHIEAAGWRYRALEWGNARRVSWSRIAYGDQGIFLRRNVFQQVGGFPDVPLLEDLMLMHRVRRLGRPALLAGPLFVDPRRWQRHGVIRQTLRNWSILAAHRCGVSPQRLASWYRRHDR